MRGTDSFRSPQCHSLDSPLCELRWRGCFPRSRESLAARSPVQLSLNSLFFRQLSAHERPESSSFRPFPFPKVHTLACPAGQVLLTNEKSTGPVYGQLFSRKWVVYGGDGKRTRAFRKSIWALIRKGRIFKMSRLFKGCFVLFVIFAALALPSASQGQVAVGVSIRIGPPALPVYPQPICPGPGYIWTPGYWAYGPTGYYWVPGTWVVAPAVGLLWTPGYWGWSSGAYVWHGGYWGPHVGFYGGINYGFGYTGVGFVGGAWHGGVFAYNTAVTNVNTTVIHNTYNTTVINNNTTVNRVSYNGGTGGTTAQPTAAEQAAAREKRTPPTALQTEHEHAASTNRAMLASENRGQPSVAATSKPGVFTGRVVAAHSTSVHANAN